MQIRLAGLTDTGLVRPTNEDAFLIDEAHQVYAVADGLGGLPGGAETSARIVQLLQKTFDKIGSLNARPDLGDLVIEINRIIVREGMEAHPFTGSGSTLTIGQIVEETLYIAHVGDSAAYIQHSGTLEKITSDHTMAQELIDRIGESARATMPPEYPHTLTRCIGQDDAELRVDQTRVRIESGDRILFCTDGLNKVLSTEEIHTILKKGNEPATISQQLVDAANQNEGPDNITIIVGIVD